MIKELRRKFNSEFTPEIYAAFIKDINESGGNNLDFRICETPLFITEELSNELVNACNEIIDIISTDDFYRYSLSSIPAEWNVPGEDKHTSFLQIDFAITQNERGKYIPLLIELQGFPTVYFYQLLLEEKIREYFSIPGNMTSYYNALSAKSYASLLREIIVEEYDPENVILLEIEPEKQKTRIDFYLTEKHLGIKTICITKLIKHGKKLFYKENNKEIPVKRIYNRVIFDELAGKSINYNFRFTDLIDITWAGHPNWYYRISKYILPFISQRDISSNYAPECKLLNEFNSYPVDLNKYVLKPLYSFAGSGVEINVTKELLDSIKQKENYILQRKVEYAPLVETPDGYSKAEIRMMFVWKDKDLKPLLVNNLVRMSKGKMMGVSFNKDKTWVGSSIAYH
jgi:hypothetical protein